MNKMQYNMLRKEAKEIFKQFYLKKIAAVLLAKTVTETI